MNSTSIGKVDRSQQLPKQQQQQSSSSSSSSGLPSSSSFSLAKNFSMTRGFSRVEANEEILTEARSRIETNLAKDRVDKTSGGVLNELSLYSFMLPNLSQYDNDDYKFREYLNQDLIEMPTLHALNDSGHLNWWTRDIWEDVVRPLYPLVTSGDGNCLLHAASLSMWGLHDRHLSLRRSLHSTLENIKENDSPLWRRWKWEQMCQNRKYGLIYNEDEWSREWRSLLRLSSYQPRTSTTTTSNDNQSSSMQHLPPEGHSTSEGVGGNQETAYFESLEEFHVFLLAHILQRPVIIVSDTMLHDSDGEPLSPIPFGGIYLPLECNPASCHRYPLVLAYDSAHFSALVLMENPSDNYDIENITNITEINKKLQLKYPYAVIPITYANKELLPVHFAVDPGPNYDWSKFPHTDDSNSGHQFKHLKLNDANNNDSVEIELSQSEKMFLIQKYLDIVKLDLFDPGPVAKRNVPTNSSGLRVNIVNLNVSEPPPPPPTSQFTSQSNPTKQNGVSGGKSGLKQKIAKFFRKNEPVYTTGSKTPPSDYVDQVESQILSGGKLRKSVKGAPNFLIKNLKSNNKTSSVPQPISYREIDPQSTAVANNSNSSVPFLNKQATIFHKQVTFKTWHQVFDLLDANNHYNSASMVMLGVKLNLAKPPRYKQMIFNYIQSAKQKYEILKQQQILQQHQQQQQLQKVKYTSQPNFQSHQYDQQPHYCVANQSNCNINNLCNHCRLSMNSTNSVTTTTNYYSGNNNQPSSNNSSLKSLNLNTNNSTSQTVSPTSRTQFSYNTTNVNRNSKVFTNSNGDNNNNTVIKESHHHIKNGNEYFVVENDQQADFKNYISYH